MNYNALTEKKQRLSRYQPFPKELLVNLNDWFRIELTYTSNAIEGNTLTRNETALVVEKGLAIGGKSIIEHLEATNHAKAFDWVQKKIQMSSDNIKEKDILSIHEMILKGIDDHNAGRYRTVSVRISGSTVILPNSRKVPDLMKELMQWVNQSHSLHPVELAAEAHYQLVTIHPFVDGNGRTARLLMNMILMQHGYPPAIIRKRDRLAYINSLEHAQLGGSKKDYFKIVYRAVDRSLDIYMQSIQEKGDFKMQKKKLLKIGDLAKEVGESNSTIRHWTKEGLLTVEEVTPSGYQLYSMESIHTVKKIHDLKKQRLTLKEIRKQLLKN